MKWIRYRMEILAEAEDLVIASLADAGVEGVEIEDRRPLTEEEKAQMFVDIPLVEGEDDGRAFLQFYLEPDADQEAILSRVNAELEELRAFTDIGPANITVSETEDKDWINQWKQFFKPFRAGGFYIVPTWEEPGNAGDDEIVLRIDPGLAFGTGMHETTQLCLAALKKHVKAGNEILDVGTGSGILQIAAKKLGASRCVGTDLDLCTVESLADNKRANGIEDADCTLIIGDLISDEAIRQEAGYERYDIVVANILAGVLVNLTPQVVPALKPGGLYITSGILDGQEQSVIDACSASGLKLLEITRMGEWACVTAYK